MGKFGYLILSEAPIRNQIDKNMVKIYVHNLIFAPMRRPISDDILKIEGGIF
jgi:hypothetical protein